MSSRFPKRFESKLTSILGLILALSLGSASRSFAQSGSRSLPPQSAPPSFRSQNQFRQPLPQQGSGSRSSDLTPTRRQFAPQPRVAPTAPSRRGGFDQVDHRLWDQLLTKYVDASGNVDYRNWQANVEDRGAVREYLRRLMRVDTRIQSSVPGRMAFWINTYNALTIEGILQVFPVQSIKDYAPNEAGYNIWDDFKLKVDGRELSLNDIEHKVLRPMGEPRIHFAIVCASRGCPQLIQRAYFPQSLDQQLTENARRFFADQNKFRYDARRGSLAISPIIQWFGEDFGANETERLRYLSQFLPDRDAARLAASGQATVSYLDYDWNLNITPVRVEARRTQRLERQVAGEQFSDLYRGSQVDWEQRRGPQERLPCETMGIR
jgi:hypothetical protein